MALVFPEEESQALSTLGWQGVYRELTADNGFIVERYFWDRRNNQALSPDSDRRLGIFPLICFSLNFEGDYLRLINMLRAEDLPVRSADRGDWPLIMAGGPIAFLNPFPVLPSLDFVFVGESEDRFAKIALIIRESWLSGQSGPEALKQVSPRPGILIQGQRHKVRKQISYDQANLLPSPVHSSFISSKAVFRDSFLVEINRGCPYGCRFCAAGFIYRPPRSAHLARVKKIIQAAAPRKVGLVGTALTDWPDLKQLLAWLHRKKIKFSLASMRADGLDRTFLEFLRNTGTRTITLAVEGISRTLRTAANKHFDEEKFFTAVENISDLRFNTLKLYFILGLPGENLSDLDELALFLEKLEKARQSGKGGKQKGVDLISISASMFVPKPWTPLQWASMDSEQSFQEKTSVFKKMCSSYRGLTFKAEKASAARIQGLLSRGDQKVHDLLLLASEYGDSWRKALKTWTGKMEDYVDREFPAETCFAWDIIDIGVDKKYLFQEWKKYNLALMTSPCDHHPCSQCRRCGMDGFLQEQERVDRT